MDQVLTIMDERLRGGLGVRDVKVRALGDQHVRIDIAGVTPEDAKKLIGKPGKLEVRIGNVSAFTGDELDGDYLYDITLSTKRNMSLSQRKVESLALMAQLSQVPGANAGQERGHQPHHPPRRVLLPSSSCVPITSLQEDYNHMDHSYIVSYDLPRYPMLVSH